jgi:hypothetical protein
MNVDRCASPTNPAAFDATASMAVTGIGAPA